MPEPTTVDETLAEIRRLLAEAYKHYFEKSDGHCKSSEGAIAIHYPPFFWDPEYHRGKSPEPGVEIYSYVLGPHRSHYFDTATEALVAVREWHANEMACTYDDAWDEA
jgi:hypothetical protein